MAEKSATRFQGLQVLRGVAVLLVIWTHIKHTANFAGVPWLDNHVGNVGVDVFFVISGFVISFSAQSLKFSPSAFLVNRFSRIAPLFWLTSLPLICVALSKDFGAAWNGAVTTFTFLPLFDFGAFTAPTNNFGWTLCFEFWFYLAFGLMMLFYGRHAWKMLIVAFILGTTVVFFFYRGSYYLPTFIFGPIIYEFVAGMLIFHLREKIGLHSMLFALAFSVAFGLQLMLGQADFGDYMADYTAGFARVFFCGGFGIALVVFFVGLDNVWTIEWPKSALLIGDSSYSIYLLQAYALWAAINLRRSLDLAPWLTACLFVALCLSLGISGSYLFEMRLTRLVRRWLYDHLPGVGDREVAASTSPTDLSVGRVRR